MCAYDPNWCLEWCTSRPNECYLYACVWEGSKSTYTTIASDTIPVGEAGYCGYYVHSRYGAPNRIPVFSIKCSGYTGRQCQEDLGSDLPYRMKVNYREENRWWLYLKFNGLEYMRRSVNQKITSNACLISTCSYNSCQGTRNY